MTSFAVGDKVFGFSEWRFGAHAEIPVDARDGSIAIIPANVTYEVAAAGAEGSHYALSMITNAKIQSGQHVLVNGATGAIGTAAIQLLKRLGVVVTAVCATEHVELVRGLGADRVIDYTTEDFTKDEQTYDVVIDAVGKSSFGRCRRLLKPRGIYLSSDLGPWPRTRSWGSSLRVREEEGPVPHPAEVRPGAGAGLQGDDRGGGVHAGHRPAVSPGSDRRGLPVRRDREEDRQRRDHRRTRELVARRLVPLRDLDQPPAAHVDVLPSPAAALALRPIHQGVLHLAVKVAPTVLALDDDGVGAPALRAGGRHRSTPIVVMSISEQASMPSSNLGMPSAPAGGRIQVIRVSADDNIDCS